MPQRMPTKTLPIADHRGNDTTVFQYGEDGVWRDGQGKPLSAEVAAKVIAYLEAERNKVGRF
jgi:hypothetical protein